MQASPGIKVVRCTSDESAAYGDPQETRQLARGQVCETLPSVPVRRTERYIGHRGRCLSRAMSKTKEQPGRNISCQQSNYCAIIVQYDPFYDSVSSTLWPHQLVADGASEGQ